MKKNELANTGRPTSKDNEFGQNIRASNLAVQTEKF